MNKESVEAGTHREDRVDSTDEAGADRFVVEAKAFRVVRVSVVLKREFFLTFVTQSNKFVLPCTADSTAFLMDRSPAGSVAHAVGTVRAVAADNLESKLNKKNLQR